MITFFLLTECRNIVFLQGIHFIQKNNSFKTSSLYDSFVAISIEDNRVIILHILPGKRLITFLKIASSISLSVSEMENEFET